ncbi:MAG: right-handed parallel beta-helix repeat-containing protein [Verrucomicrobiota bacterium]
MKAPRDCFGVTCAFFILGCLSSVVFGKTLVVSPDGSDDADKRPETPYRTISRAAAFAEPGDTILVKAGIYRERVAPPRGGEPGRPITYKGEHLGAVFIRGSDEWAPAWRRETVGVFSARPGDELFDRDDVYIDSPNPFRVPLASTPANREGKPEVERGEKGDGDLVFTCGQVIVDGALWEQLPFLKEVGERPRCWWFDPLTGRLHVNFGNLDPAACRVEITTRRRLFAPHIRGLGHLIVEGFVMEHCGNQYPTNFWNTPKWAQAGALGLRGGHHWIVRGNLIRYANTLAMDVGAGGNDNQREKKAEAGAPMGEGNLVENNYLVDNGAGGIIGLGTSRLVVRGNVILRNNTLGFTGRKRYEHAGFKAHAIRDGVIEGNYVADNPLSPGIWLDNQFPGTRVTRNVIVNNGGRGLFLEMSDYPFDSVLIDHNISVGNRSIQFYVHDASGSTVIHNLFANSPVDAKYGQGAYVYQATNRTRTGNHAFYNNLFVNHKVMLDINYPAHRGGLQRFDHNVYGCDKGDRQFLINRYTDRPVPWDPEVFVERVRKDLGSAGAPESLEDGNRMALTLANMSCFPLALLTFDDCHLSSKVDLRSETR